MKRLKIMKSYVVLWLFIYFLIYSSMDYIVVFFMATLTFNLAVLTVLTIGIIMVMKAAVNLVMLAGTFGILAYKKDNLKFYLKDIDRIMPANIAHMFNSRAEKGMLLFTTEESRDVIDWIEEKFAHQNRYTNYFTGTVLMIGLLGTFSGLLIAIDDMGRIILSLSGDIDLAKVISDFSGPLGGMAVGFGSSLFGVIAAIILGLKGYILNKNQEIFVEGVEDWLKGRIIDSGGAVSGSIGSDGNELPDHKSSFMDVFIENLSGLTKEMGKISQSNERLTSITVASVQQARDEHESSIDIFEDISKSLQNIDLSGQKTTQILKQQFGSLQISMNTNHEQLILQQQESIKLMIEKIENSLEQTHKNITQKFQDIADSSSKDIDAVATEIALILNNINTDLKAEQNTLAEMQSSGQLNQTANERLLKKLVNLFEESAHKLDSEFNILNVISKNIDTSNSKSQNHFELISELINSFSKTLQDELVSLNAIQDVQENQSKLIKESVNKSQDIYETLQISKEQSLKSNSQLDLINTKIELMKDDFVELNTQNLEQNQKDLELITSKIDDVILTNQSKSVSSSPSSAGFFEKLFK